jgi:hypothetical protein
MTTPPPPPRVWLVVATDNDGHKSEYSRHYTEALAYRDKPPDNRWCEYCVEQVEQEEDP